MIPLSRLLDRIANGTRASYDADRRQHPERFTAEPDGLAPTHFFVENVARMLGCHVDHVRRIPREELPASRVGARLIYARADIEAYIQLRRDKGGGRYISHRGVPAVGPEAKAKPKLQPVAPTFDPLVAVRKALRTR